MLRVYHRFAYSPDELRSVFLQQRWPLCRTTTSPGSVLFGGAVYERQRACNIFFPYFDPEETPPLASTPSHREASSARYRGYPLKHLPGRSRIVRESRRRRR